MVFQIGEFSEEVREITSQSDRGAAIVGFALLDKPLVEILAWRGRAASELAKQPMAVRIERARALRYLTSMEYHDLRTLGKVRNVFAHDTHVRLFMQPQVASLCANLQIPEVFFPPLLLGVPHDPRARFVCCVGLLLRWLQEIRACQKLHGSKLTMWKQNKWGQKEDVIEHTLLFENLIARGV